jgi:AcrR family transcriptional regulator
LEVVIDESSVPASRKGAQTRKDLLDATLRIIVRDGHQQVTLRNVAKEAGQSHGSIVYHYGSRAALMSAATEFANDYLYQRSCDICSRWRAGPADLESFTELLVKFYRDYLVKNEAMGTVVLELNLAAAREEYLRPILYKWGERLQNVYEEPFRRIGSPNVAMDFQLFLNAMNGVLSAQRSFPRRQFESRILRSSIVRLLHAIACDNG